MNKQDLFEQQSNSGVYLIEFDTGCKFGRSANLKQRLKDYRKPWCREILQVKTWANLDAYGCDLYNLESSVLNKIKEEHKVGEYITGLTFDEIVSLIKQVRYELDVEDSDLTIDL